MNDTAKRNLIIIKSLLNCTKIIEQHTSTKNLPTLCIEDNKLKDVDRYCSFECFKSIQMNKELQN